MDNDIHISVGPSAVRLLGIKESLSAGQPYEVRCEAVGARPAPKITWWRGEKKITKGISKPQVFITINQDAGFYFNVTNDKAFEEKRNNLYSSNLW